MEAKLVSCTKFTNQMYLTYADIVPDVIVFGSIAAMTEIV